MLTKQYVQYEDNSSLDYGQRIDQKPNNQTNSKVHCQFTVLWRKIMQIQEMQSFCCCLFFVFSLCFFGVLLLLFVVDLFLVFFFFLGGGGGVVGQSSAINLTMMVSSISMDFCQLEIKVLEALPVESHFMPLYTLHN